MKHVIILKTANLNEVSTLENMLTIARATPITEGNNMLEVVKKTVRDWAGRAYNETTGILTLSVNGKIKLVDIDQRIA